MRTLHAIITASAMQIKPGQPGTPAKSASLDVARVLLTNCTEYLLKRGKTMYYNYLEAVTSDTLEAIKENYSAEEIARNITEDRDSFAQKLNDELRIDDSVTGNASGSYWCNAYNAEEALMHNLDLLGEACEEFGCGCDVLKDGAESCDVTIRCYLLYQAIEEALDELEEDEEISTIIERIENGEDD